ncbi:D-amino acid oxidase [Amphichorda felina]
MGETVVVIGAGVSGLTTALLLSKDKANDVTVVAKHMPGDYDIERKRNAVRTIAKSLAGTFRSLNLGLGRMGSKEDSRFETQTWHELKRLCQDVPEAGIRFQRCQIQRREKDNGPSTLPNALFDPKPWFADLFPDYHELAPADVLPGYDSGCEYTSVCINTAIYLPWLVGQLLKNGVKLKRTVVSDIRDAKKMSHTGRPATLIINASGLGSLKLGGVRDTTMFPARGQVVVVRNEMDAMLIVSGTEDGPSDALYAMTRGGGGGSILGGTFQADSWESQPDPSTALRIMKRVVEVKPEIAGGKGIAGLDVIRHAVGLRPYRKGGVRIEEERLDDETWIVHNYGHGGWGYQGSYGCANEVVGLVAKIQQKKQSCKAKL